MRRALPLLLALALPGTANAIATGSPFLVHRFDASGDPYLLGFSPYGTTPHSPSWAICRPDRPCLRHRVSDADLSAGRQPRGTRFTFTVTYEGTTKARCRARSKPAPGCPLKTGRKTSHRWRGRVVPAALPQLAGSGATPFGAAPRVGDPIDATVGTWRGGWPGDHHHLQIQVCAAQAVANCEVIADAEAGFPPPVTLEAQDAGKYVYAVDERVPRDWPAPTGSATGSPRDLVAAGAYLPIAVSQVAAQIQR